VVDSNKYNYKCDNCGTEWFTNKKIKKKYHISNVRFPGIYDVQEQKIKNPDGTIKTIKLKVIKIKKEKQKRKNRMREVPYFVTAHGISRHHFRLDKCPDCISDQKEAELYRKINELKKNMKRYMFTNQH